MVDRLGLLEHDITGIFSSVASGSDRFSSSGSLDILWKVKESDASVLDIKIDLLLSDFFDKVVCCTVDFS